jgi:AraC-like DNA-binding protein
MMFALFSAPCLWMFARDISTKQHKLKSLNLRWRGLPILLSVLLLLPLASSIHSGSSFNNEFDPLTPHYTFFLHSTMLMMAGIFFIQSLYYLKQCMGFIRQRLEQNKSLFAQTSDSGVNTLRVLVLIVLANFVVNVMRVLYCWILDDVSIVNLLFSFVQVSLIVYLCFAVVAHAINYSMGCQLTRESLFGTSSDVDENNTSKYKHSALDAKRRANILGAIETLFNQENCYRNSRLNLDLLCEKLGDLPYVVSQAINQSEYQNFYRLVNQYRVTEAQSLLLENMDRPILDIAYSVGYNSKSTFNTAFKKYSGLSPSDYRKAFSHAPHTKHLSC